MPNLCLSWITLWIAVQAQVNLKRGKEKGVDKTEKTSLTTPSNPLASFGQSNRCFGATSIKIRKKGLRHKQFTSGSTKWEQLSNIGIEAWKTQRYQRPPRRFLCRYKCYADRCLLAATGYEQLGCNLVEYWPQKGKQEVPPTRKYPHVPMLSLDTHPLQFRLLQNSQATPPAGYLS